MKRLRVPEQTLARHFLSRICSSYSSRNVFRVLITRKRRTLTKAAQSHGSESFLQVLSSSTRSLPFSPSPPTIFSRISSIRLVPSRHGTHLPQDSLWVKLMKKRATSTIQVFVIHNYQTTGTDDGIKFLDGIEIKWSHPDVFLTRHPPDGPPICTAFESEHRLSDRRRYQR